MILGFDIVGGSGNVVTREYDVKDFHSVRLAGIGSLSIDQTGEESLRIEAEDNLLDYLKVEVRGHELYLGVENKVSLRPTRSINYFLTVKDLEGIALTGSGSIHTSPLQASSLAISLTGSSDLDTGRLSIEKDFSLRLSGSGHSEMQSIKAENGEIIISGSGKMRSDEIEMAQIKLGITGAGDMRFRNVRAESIETHISGSGNIELDGKTTEQELRISAAGKYRAQSFESARAKIKISGSGSAWVAVEERLDARISGAGSIHYRGRPVVVQSISGSGKVKYSEG